MGVSFGPTPLPNYLFIDGGCVEATCEYYSKGFFAEELLSFDYRKLGASYTKVFYYNSLPPRMRDETDENYEVRTAPKRAFFDQLRRIDKFHVYEGTTHRRRRVIEQKQVDIMIAVHMLSHAHRHNMQKATLLTGDLDFKPLIDSLVAEGLYVTLQYPPSHTNHELIDAADSRSRFDLSAIHALIDREQAARFPIPRGVSEPKDADPDWRVVKSWKCPKNGEVRLYQVAEELILFARDPLNIGYWQKYRSTQESTLKFFLRDTIDLIWYEG